ncbi:MAG TPA: hypothetical protein ENN67_02940, partial [Firmicutes bacterium]|nr:hypothetical protein [Bacillota bacterium]
MSFRAEWPNFLIVAIFVVALMAPFTLGGKALMPDTWKSIHPWARGLDPYDNQASIYDTVLEYEPWFIYSQQCLKEGRVPHWNPWQFCGAPLYANRLVPFFFPPFILAEIISQPSKILGWFQLFNLIISGWGMYFLLRGWRLMPSVSTLSSCLYLTCGFHFLPFPLWTLGTIGFPWLLWVLDGFLKKPGLKPIATSGFIAGMILMVGYPVLVVHLSYFTVMYFIARWWATRRTGSGRLHWSIPPLVLAAIFIIGFGISAIANVPAQHYSRQTVRHVEGFTDKAFEYEKRKLLATKEETGLDVITERFGERADILLPINGRGTQRAWQYAGVLVYLLAFLGILSGRPRARLLAILGLIFAIIVWIPEIYIALLDYLPGWALTILLPIHVVNLTACLLAAFGIESLFSEKWKPDTIGKIIFLILTIAGITLTFNMLRNAPIVDVPIADIIREKNLLATSPFHLYYLVALTVISCAIAALIFIRSKILFARYFVVITSIIFSLSVHFYQQPVYSDSNYQPSTPFTEFVEKNIASPDDGKFNGRIARWAELAIPFNPHRRAKSPFTPNIHLKWGLYDVGGYDSLVPKRYIDYHSLFEEAIMEYRALAAYRAPDTMRHKRFRDMAVRWIITQGELPPEGREGLSLIWDDRF